MCRKDGRTWDARKPSTLVALEVSETIEAAEYLGFLQGILDMPCKMVCFVIGGCGGSSSVHQQYHHTTMPTKAASKTHSKHCKPLR
eukprot:4955983-Amphidinium_carterae.1